jgi:hypothetical protein
MEIVDYDNDYKNWMDELDETYREVRDLHNSHGGREDGPETCEQIHARRKSMLPFSEMYFDADPENDEPPQHGPESEDDNG